MFSNFFGTGYGGFDGIDYSRYTPPTFQPLRKQQRPRRTPSGFQQPRKGSQHITSDNYKSHHPEDATFTGRRNHHGWYEVVFDDGVQQFVPAEWIEPIKSPRVHRQHTAAPSDYNSDNAILDSHPKSPEITKPKGCEVGGVIIEEFVDDTERVPPERRLPDDSIYILEEITSSS